MINWQQYLADNQPRFLNEFFDFVRIPSISALPEHAADVQAAAEWVAARLTQAGMENATVLPTGGHPVVYADWLHAPDQPTVLIYAHFDVQPVDPVELWTSPPFEPTLKDGRIYARGASDDKGNLAAVIFALEAMLQTSGQLPINVKIIFEGQEEIGSPQLPAFMVKERERFAADVVFTADGLMWSEDEACLVVGLKGLTALQINVRGAKSDLHSGLHGGAINNPLHALVKILASLRDDDGTILVEGFFDNVLPLTDSDRERIGAIPFDLDDYKADLDIPDIFGEPGYTTRERAWARPTLELNGVWGGFQGEGTKTVIPNEAHAKITCRLVADQDPDDIAEKIAAHVYKHTPPGVTVSVDRLPGSSTPYLMPDDHPGNAIAADVLTELYDGKQPYFTRLGGSIPVVPLFLKELGAFTVNFGFTLDDENLHAPNEFYRLKNFDRAQRGYCLLLHRLAGQSFS